METPESMQEATRKPARVLVVDDDPSTVALVARHLRNAGYDVLTAESGQAALRILVTEDVRIVVTDWMMPGMSGLDLCRAIRMHEGIPWVHVVVLTARTGSDELIEAFDAGADDYLCKPLNHRELLARIRAGERILDLQQDLSARHREVYLINAEMAIAQEKLADANQRLNLLATTDELTGLLNRREGMSRLDELWALSVRHDTPLSVIALDLDHFKSFNDVYGHAIGDAVLRAAATTLQAKSRIEDYVCRIGGEEFLILCPHAREEEAGVAAERLRRSLEDKRVCVADLVLSFTVSLGVAQRTASMGAPDALLRASDEALYAAKDAGRNRVSLARDATSTAKSTKAESPSDAAAPSIANDTGRPRLLLMDGESAGRSSCRKILQSAGYAVDAFAGTEALAHPDGCQGYDAIIVAAKLRGQDGLSFIKTLKSEPDTKHIPVILTAPRTDGLDPIHADGTGPDEFIREPVDKMEMLIRIQSVLRAHRQLSEAAFS